MRNYGALLCGMKQPRPTDSEVARFARYWFRADLMHKHVHALVEKYEPNLSGMKSDDYWEFETYLVHWVSALFVLVEGFNKLKLRDARVERLFNAHVGQLKAARHETYHFVLKQTEFDKTIFGHKGLNWAEELHDAIGEHVKENVLLKASVARFMEKRVKAK
jgi:hypothetical protein